MITEERRICHCYLSKFCLPILQIWLLIQLLLLLLFTTNFPSHIIAVLHGTKIFTHYVLIIWSIWRAAHFWPLWPELDFLMRKYVHLPDYGFLSFHTENYQYFLRESFCGYKYLHTFKTIFLESRFRAYIPESLFIDQIIA